MAWYNLFFFSKERSIVYYIVLFKSVDGKNSSTNPYGIFIIIIFL